MNKRVCFMLFLLISGVFLGNTQQSQENNADSEEGEEEDRGQDQNQNDGGILPKSMIVSAKDADNSYSPMSLRPEVQNPLPKGSKLDTLTDDQVRDEAKPLNDWAYEDPKGMRRDINLRRSSVPNINESMDKMYQNVIDHLGMINCKHPHTGSKSTETQFIESLLSTQTPTDNYSLCDQDIAPVVFMPLSDLKSTRSSIYRYFKDNIYQPLGYEFPANRFSYADTISDLINMDKDNSVIHKNMQGLNFANFSNIITEAFKSIELFSSDFDKNKGTISKQMIDILKSFHIFWNVLRQKNQIGQTKSQTLAIVKNMMHQFKKTNAAMKATTLSILENVRNGYFRFMRAHRYQQLVQKNPLDTIAFQMVERYKQNVVRIKNRIVDGFSTVSEMSEFLEMLTAFHAVNFNAHYSAEESIHLFQQKIANVITTTYNVFQDVMVQNHDDSFFQVRDFTAILLLKMMHRNYVMLKYYTMEEFLKLQKEGSQKVFEKVIKFYEEIIDSVLLIPSTCQSSIGKQLEICFKENLDKVLGNYSRKYMLQASIAGVNLFRFVQQSFDEIVKDLQTAGASDNFILFKSKFVKRTSEFFRAFRSRYQINDMADVEELEDNIGFQVEKIKTENSMLPLSLAMIDSFDKELYNFFLEIKSSYNPYAPVTKDPRILNSIVQKLKTVILNFKSDNAKRIDVPIEQLFRTVYRQAKMWVEQHSVHFVVNTHPVNLRFEKSNFLSDSQGKTPDTYDVSFNKPALNANVMTPMSQQQIGFDQSEEMFAARPLHQKIV